MTGLFLFQSFEEWPCGMGSIFGIRYVVVFCRNLLTIVKTQDMVNLYSGVYHKTEKGNFV